MLFGPRMGFRVQHLAFSTLGCGSTTAGLLTCGSLAATVISLCVGVTWRELARVRPKNLAM